MKITSLLLTAFLFISVGQPALAQLNSLNETNEKFSASVQGCASTAMTECASKVLHLVLEAKLSKLDPNYRTWFAVGNSYVSLNSQQANYSTQEYDGLFSFSGFGSSYGTIRIQSKCVANDLSHISGAAFLSAHPKRIDCNYSEEGTTNPKDAQSAFILKNHYDLEIINVKLKP